MGNKSVFNIKGVLKDAYKLAEQDANGINFLKLTGGTSLVVGLSTGLILNYTDDSLRFTEIFHISVYAAEIALFPFVPVIFYDPHLAVTPAFIPEAIRRRIEKARKQNPPEPNSLTPGV